MRRPSTLCVLALATACSGGAAESTTETTTSSATTTEPASETSRTTTTAPVRITTPACGYGGSSPAVAIFVDVETDVALSGVAFSLAIADPATHAVVGHSREPMQTVVSPVERGLLDFSTQGTTPFDGTLAAGARTRVQYWSGMDELPPSLGGPIELHLTMTAAGGQQLEATCTTEEMWPSS
jgi:hypothetical protein